MQGESKTVSEPEFPRKVLNSLREGQDLAAKVPNTPPDHYAWVHICPIPERKIRFRDVDGRVKLVRTTEGKLIRGFLVRYLVAEKSEVEEIYGGRRQNLVETVEDIRIQVDSMEELSSLVQQWITDFTEFHVPSYTGYRFGACGNLMEQRKPIIPYSQLTKPMD